MNSRTKMLAGVMTGAVLLAWVFGFSAAARADEIPAKYRPTVNKALEYLAKAQTDDGHWGAVGDTYPVAMTGLAGVALLMEGSTVNEGKYAKQIKLAADWLMSHSQMVPARDGLIYSEHPSERGRYMFGHGFATLFLACVYCDEADPVRRPRLKDVLTRAVKFTASTQSSKGGFFYVSSVEGGDFDEGAATITQIQALRACRNAGIAVPKDMIQKIRKYLEDSTSLDGGVIYSLARNNPRPAGGGKPALTAGALACTFTTGDYKNKLVQEWFKFCKRYNLDQAPRKDIGYEEYTHYYFAQALYLLGDDGWGKMFPGSDEPMTWTKYRDSFFPHLVEIQNADGSFATPRGIGLGGVYTTAKYCTIMRLDRGVVPLYQRAIGRSE